MIDLSKDDIRLLTDDASFVRGMGYLAERRVFDPLLADARLTGRAVGSMDIPYEMEIVLGPDGVESGRCTCSRGGFCRHLVALAVMLVERSRELARSAAPECVDAMIGLAGIERVDPAARLAWLEIVVPLYLQDDYGLGEQLGEVIAEVASTAECDHAIDLVRGELPADLLRRSGREEEADAVFLEAEFNERTVLYRIATGKPADALEHAVPHLQSAGSRHADMLELWARATELTGEPDRTLGLRFSAFVEQPSVRTYDAVMTTARQLAREAEIEEKMLAALPRDDGGLPALVELHVHRRDVDAAVEAFDRIERYRSEDLALKVATLAATRRPDVSRRLITEIVEDHIARKNRSHYARAAHVAIRLRDVMTPSELGDYLRDLRERYRRLRALQDELDIVFGR